MVFKIDLGYGNPTRSVGNFQCLTVVIGTLSIHPPIHHHYIVYLYCWRHTHIRLVDDVGYKVVGLQARDTVKPKTFYCIFVYMRVRGAAFTALCIKYNKIFASPRFAAQERGGGFKRTFRKAGSCSSVSLICYLTRICITIWPLDFCTYYTRCTHTISKSPSTYNIYQSRDDYWSIPIHNIFCHTIRDVCFEVRGGGGGGEEKDRTDLVKL